MYYKGTGARILGNYFAFNSFEQRTAYTLNNMAQRSVVAYNTLLYNGDKAGHYSWARGNIHHHNLVIGQRSRHGAIADADDAPVLAALLVRERIY